jgi:hypothetical protein
MKFRINRQLSLLLLSASMVFALTSCGGGGDDTTANDKSSPERSQAYTVPASTSNAVTPINWSAFSTTTPTDTDATRVKNILKNANKYALNDWWNSIKNFDSQTGTYLSFGGNGETNIRPNSSQAISLAVSLKLGGYDAAHTGVSNAVALSYVNKLVRSLAYRHLINTSGGWGNDWQTALWAAQIGQAAWLIWDDLTSTDKEYVRKMVEYEANRFIGYQTPYFKNTTGTVITPGDSKAEENSWNATVLQIATAMMPNHASWPAWMAKSAELMISAFATPSNINNTSSFFNGKSLSWWLKGSNANPDFTVINHDRIHPDYMITITQNLRAGLIYPMAGKAAPRAATVNANPLYKALVDLQFSAGASYPDTNTTIASPGGSIFIPNSSDLYFPQGNDWGTLRRMNSALLSATVRAFGLDTQASSGGATWEPRHAQKVLDMQNRFTSGKTYGASSEDTYAGREEWVAMNAAYAYWAKWVKFHNLYSTTDEDYPIVIDNKDRGFAVVAGTWTSNTTGTDKLGTGFRAKSGGTGSSKAKFNLDIPVAGTYKAYAWWPARGINATNTPFTVAHSSGNTVVNVNQQTNGGKWNLLGTYSFSAGTGKSIEISDNANGEVVADGVMLIRQ